MTTYTHTSNDKIVFDDGARGTQLAHHYDDGSTKLIEIVITRRPDGKRCRDVYCHVSDVQSHVYSLSGLSGRRWSVDSESAADTK